MAHNSDSVPYADIDAVFLDVGNTLISIDFDRSPASSRRGALPCEPGCAPACRGRGAARVLRAWCSSPASGPIGLFFIRISCVFEQAAAWLAARRRSSTIW
jgi:hypothetical protein